MLEEKINDETQRTLDKVFNLIEKFNDEEEIANDKIFIKGIQKTLSNEPKFEIQNVKEANCFIGSYKLRTSSTKTGIVIGDRFTIEEVINQLQEHANKIHESANSALDKIAEICTKRRNEAGRLEKRINEKLESLYVQEDARIQEALNKMKMNNEIYGELTVKAKLILHMNQKYSLINGNDLLLQKNPL